MPVANCPEHHTKNRLMHRPTLPRLFELDGLTEDRDASFACQISSLTCA
ncbi:hypothetical protein SAMN05428979_2976 [Stappia sp. ES.058]|nr:hypothetical protein SAMN05428979_2976 [Stappia sp. ES.058]